jgi:hypothetical protein
MIELDDFDYVVSLGAKPVYLPSKLLEVLPGQPFRQPFKSDQKDAMIRYARRTPPQSKAAILQDGMRLFGFAPLDPAKGLVSTNSCQIESMTDVRLESKLRYVGRVRHGATQRTNP